jgi:hypothetical protein
MATTLPLTSIRTDGGTQSRVKIDPEAVADYAAAYKARTAMPPLTVYHDGKDHWLADGFHRFHAAERAGLLTVRCDVKRGTKKDAAWHSVGANRQHGLRRTNADKQNAARMAVQLHPERTDRILAEHVGVDHKTIAAARAQLGNFPNSTRIGRDGKTYPATHPTSGKAKGSGVQGSDIPPPPPPEPAADDAPSEPPGDAPPEPPEDEDPADEGPPGPEDPAAGPRDKHDVEIPERRLELWGRRQEVQDMLTSLSRIRGALKKAQDEDDELFRPLNFSIAIAAVGQARAAIEVALRRYVCPMCQGDGCRLCKGTGLLGQFAWDTYLPPEFKK